MNNLKDYVNWKLTHADKTAEAEGYPLTMNNCKANKKMKQLEIYGNSVQDGTPTPDNPIEVESVGVKSVNLWNQENYIINQTKDSILRDLYPTDYSWLKKGETITVSATIFVSENDTRTTTRLSILTIGTDGAVYQNIKSHYSTKGEEIRVSLTYTIPEMDVDIKSLRIRFIDYSANTENVWDAYVKDIQIEIGSTVTPYEPYGKYKIPVVQKGINLFSMAKAGLKQKTINGITFTPLEDERIHIKGTLEDTTKGAVYNYTFSGQPVFEPGIYNAKNTPFVYSGTDLLFNTAKASGGYLVNINSSANNINITERAYISGIYIGIRAGNTREWDDIWELQVTQGANTRNLPYEPYVEPVTTNIFLDEPLRKIGDYADYVDFKENKVVRNTSEKVFDGSEDWIFGTTKEITQVFYYVINSYNPAHCISNRFVSGLDGDVEKLVSLGDKIYLAIKKTTASDVDTFKTWLSENNVDVIYSLAEPTEEPIPCELPKLNAKTTIIEVDTSLAPSNMYGKYIKR